MAKVAVIIKHTRKAVVDTGDIPPALLKAALTDMEGNSSSGALARGGWMLGDIAHEEWVLEGVSVEPLDKSD